jgi:AFG3 family protein
MSKDELLDRMCMTLGGRVAEAIVFGKISTGFAVLCCAQGCFLLSLNNEHKQCCDSASDDLDRVTKQAYAQVASFGMNERLGVVAYPMQDGGDPYARPVYSEATSRLIDDEVRQLVDTAYRRTHALLSSHKALLERLGARLLAAEQLQTADLVDVLGARVRRSLYYRPAIYSLVSLSLSLSLSLSPP